MSGCGILAFIVAIVLTFIIVLSNGLDSLDWSFILQLILLISLIFTACFLLRMRYSIRQKMMKKTADEFNLRFYAEPPLEVSEFSVPPLYFNRKTSMNHIVGEYKDNKIHVYDMFLPVFGEKMMVSKKLYWSFFESTRRTSIEINGERMKYGSFLFEGFYFAPVSFIRSKLQELSKE